MECYVLRGKEVFCFFKFRLEENLGMLCHGSNVVFGCWESPSRKCKYIAWFGRKCFEFEKWPIDQQC